MVAFSIYTFFGTDVQLAVETAAQNQKSHAVHVKIVAAAGTPAECGQKSGYGEHDHPDDEQCPHGSVGGGYLTGNQEGGDIYEQSAEQQ